MKQAASAGGECFRLFFKEVPTQWQPIVFITLFIIIVLLIITTAGFQIWTPLLRLHVRQREERIAHGDRQLQVENNRLRQQLKMLRREQDRPAIDLDQDSVEDLGEISDHGMVAPIPVEHQQPETPRRSPRRSPQRIPQRIPPNEPIEDPVLQQPLQRSPVQQRIAGEPPQGFQLRDPVENDQPRSMQQSSDDSSMKYDIQL